MIRAGIAAMLAFCLVAAAEAAVPKLRGQSASAALSSSRAGARPVALTLTLHYEMQCGSPGQGPVTVTLPARMSVPARIAASSVRVDGKTAPSVSRSGAGILIGLPPQPRIMCDSITVGTLTILFTKAAGIGNPKSAGTYAVAAARMVQTFAMKVRIA